MGSRSQRYVKAAVKLGCGLAICGGGGYGLMFLITNERADRAVKLKLVDNKLLQSIQAAAATDSNSDYKNLRPPRPLPPRDTILKALADETKEYDVLVIGGGATGAGIALDAQTRGLNTALIEKNDFSSGTSSRSTKLIHGGVRYLQAAIMKLDYQQYKMVKEALYERENLVKVAPHVAQPLPIMLPIYKWWQVPYFWIGIKMYDVVSGKKVLKRSHYISKQTATELFPMLNRDKLVGALVYYDGQMNDARMNLMVILTAIRNGAKCLNHVSAIGLVKDVNEESLQSRIRGVKVKDELTGREFVVRAKCVINATGPFTDNIRLMDNPELSRICIPSQGVHVTLPGYYSPGNTGLLDPSTKDGRVLFFLPWEKMTIAGTTDLPAELTESPAPTEDEVEFILDSIRKYLDPKVSVRRGDVLSAWAGLRPLVRDPSKTNTSALARNHIIEVSDSGMITIAGGKWTTYRQMAEETVDRAIQTCNLKPSSGCMTAGLLLEGAHNYSFLTSIHLVQNYGLDVDVRVAEHLAHTYGDRAYKIAKNAAYSGKKSPIVGVRLHENFPYLEAEVRYAVSEYASSAVDVIARRLRLSFLNADAASEVLPRVVEIMASELGWSKTEKQRQLEMAEAFIDSEMGRKAKQRAYLETPVDLSEEEKAKALKHFKTLDASKTGAISVSDLRRYFQDRGEKINASFLHDLLAEIDLNKSGLIEESEFLMLWSGLKLGTISNVRFGQIVADLERSDGRSPTPERSGGGL